METGGLLCDDALVEILVRLPSESVLRCRAVCTRWRRITTDPSFLAAHAAGRPREMVILLNYDLASVTTTPLPSLGDPTMRPGRRRFLCDRSVRSPSNGALLDTYDVLYSLDGLLVLRRPPGLYIICNPTTRQWTNLPVLTPEPCFAAYPCGFYLHGSSGEYRVLCHCLQQEKDQAGERRKRHYYILSAGRRTSARRHTGRAPDVAAPNSTRYEHPVARRGILHWFSKHPEADRTGKMLAFDTASETFRLMSRPPERAGDTSSRTLFELDGELGVVAMRNETSLDIWVLRDYEAERWTLDHRVEMPQTICGDVFRVTMVLPIGSGAILMGSPSCGVARLYNVKEKRMHRDIDVRPVSPTFLEFSESIVPHAFFESPRRWSDLPFALPVSQLISCLTEGRTVVR